MSKHKPTTLFLLLVVFSAFWTKKPLALPLLQKSKPLYQIKKLYIVDEGPGFVRVSDGRGSRLLTKDQAREVLEKEKTRYERMASLLQQELNRVGFEVVKDINDADAQLVGIIGARGSTPDDWPSDWPQPRRYLYRLMPPAKGGHFKFFSAKDKLWEAYYKMDIKMLADESDKQAASKVAENLLKAWLKSARNAGIAVGDKVQ